ncbi:SCAN domain-containing protein 3 [Trichonephila clavipes]|nr:SCAN domain-containing protein 3 [Trichonephila clavipes]
MYLDASNIPMKNITSCATDGAPNMMGKKKGCLKLMKDKNPNTLLFHCVIHKGNLVPKNISPVLNERLNLVVKCMNTIKPKVRCECLFKSFFNEPNEDYVKLRLHTKARGLLKGNCFKRFMKLFDTLNDF